MIELTEIIFGVAALGALLVAMGEWRRRRALESANAAFYREAVDMFEINRIVQRLSDPSSSFDSRPPPNRKVSSNCP